MTFYYISRMEVEFIIKNQIQPKMQKMMVVVILALLAFFSRGFQLTVHFSTE